MDFETPEQIAARWAAPASTSKAEAGFPYTRKDLILLAAGALLLWFVRPFDLFLLLPATTVYAVAPLLAPEMVFLVRVLWFIMGLGVLIVGVDVVAAAAHEIRAPGKSGAGQVATTLSTTAPATAPAPNGSAPARPLGIEPALS